MTPRHRFVRLVAAVAGVLVLGVTAGACSDTLADAATVDGTHIRRDDFKAELEDLVANEDFVGLLEQGGQFEVADDRESIGSPLAAAWLSLLLQQSAVDAEFEARGLEVTDAMRDRAREEVVAQYSDPNTQSPEEQRASVEKFPTDFLETLIERQARAAAVAEALQDDEPTVEDAREFYEQNRDALFQCATNRTVSHIVVATEEEANDVLDELDGGADFAALAEERSTEAASAAQGGVIGNEQGPRACYPAGQSQARDQAVAGATNGEPTEPVQTEAGFEVLLVEPYEAPSFEEVQDELVAQLAATPQAQFSVVLARRLRAADVWVDPRFGEWVVDDDGARVDPPVGPNVRETRNREVTPPTVNPFGGVTGQ
jgi:parvulin-like peptidyl-prolyl isomerase